MNWRVGIALVLAAHLATLWMKARQSTTAWHMMALDEDEPVAVRGSDIQADLTEVQTEMRPLNTGEKPKGNDNTAVATEVALDIFTNTIMITLTGGFLLASGLIRGLTFVVEKLPDIQKSMASPQPEPETTPPEAVTDTSEAEAPSLPRPDTPATDMPHQREPIEIPSTRLATPTVIQLRPTAPLPLQAQSPSVSAPKPALAPASLLPVDKWLIFNQVANVGQCAAATVLFIWLEKLMESFLVSPLGVPCPAVVPTLWGVYATLCLMQRFSPTFASTLLSLFAPATSFFSTWLGLFVVPTLMNVVSIPNWFAWQDFSTAAGMLVVRQLTMMAVYKQLLRLLGVSGTIEEAAGERPELRPTLPGQRSLSAGTLLACAAAAGMLLAPGSVALFRYIFYCSLLPLAYGIGLHLQHNLRARSPHLARLCHPILVASLTGLGVVQAASGLQGIPFQRGLQLFQAEPLGPLPFQSVPPLLGSLVQNSGLRSPGDLLSCLLGPGLVSLAFRLFAHRQLLLRLCLPVAGTAVLCAAGAMALTAGLLAWFPLPGPLATALLLPPAGAPWALQSAAAFGVGRPSLVAAASIFAAIYGSALLAPTMTRTPLNRPNAARAATEGAVGADAEMEAEGHNAAVSLVAATVGGTCGTLLCCCTPFRVFILWAAGL